jgi:hypothetical protein
MADTELPTVEQRLETLERLVRELKNRVAVLEDNARQAAEHPADRAVVREKATYDWQGTR